jgi:hypothetical protein
MDGEDGILASSGLEKLRHDDAVFGFLRILAEKTAQRAPSTALPSDIPLRRKYLYLLYQEILLCQLFLAAPPPKKE